jgi:hypothetical protein
MRVFEICSVDSASTNIQNESPAGASQWGFHFEYFLEDSRNRILVRHGRGAEPGFRSAGSSGQGKSRSDFLPLASISIQNKKPRRGKPTAPLFSI